MCISTNSIGESARQNYKFIVEQLLASTKYGFSFLNVSRLLYTEGLIDMTQREQL